MLEKYQPIDMNEDVKLHYIKTDKFKTNLVSVYFQRPLLREEVTHNALLSMLLPRGTQHYPTAQSISVELENLYGASLGSDVAKKGERNILQFRLQVANEAYLDEKNIFNKGLSMLDELMNNPYLENNKFSSSYLQQEKENLSEKIEGRMNDKIKYAYERCIEEMCKNENFALYEYGQKEDLLKISEENLYKHYQNIIESSPIDIFVVGDMDQRDVEEQIRKNFQFKRQNIQKGVREQIYKKQSEVRRIEETMEINQGKLNMGFRTNVAYESELYEPLVVFSNILGGGPNSKLFKNIREKESLCYYIFSRVEKFKSLMLIGSGIEFENYEKAVTLIEKEINEMKEGNFTEEDIDSAKKGIVTSIRSLTDTPSMLADFYYTQFLSGNFDSLEDIIHKIERVKKNEIVQAAQEIFLDTIYFLKGKKEVAE
ncbi:EF-P 5-aminopentanol modification-associated protein YfmF [Geosporobacter ferrireducens]|uniref:EF-P 5-aminopentanol modification-associated protein YfmF n=1 Tax=Geosporobacter ferrireducens TaxID=1424294 RepID=UPI0009F1EB0B|nr:pitrilysin family protein [Geosporobacter ferrireducens]MTI53932.1 insulinase family protein [Geosporobacter ferrireducens]